MIITPVDPGITLALPAPGYVRGEGLHISTLYNALYEGLEPTRYDSTKPMDKGRLELGQALELGLEDALKQRLIVRPGEFVEPEHGIIFSPDLFIFNGHLRVGEMKLTWLSSKGVPRVKGDLFPPKFKKYLTQMMCYCRALETPYARLLAFFVNGDYDWENKLAPKFLAWDLEFKKREMDEEWQMVMNNARSEGML